MQKRVIISPAVVICDQAPSPAVTGIQYVEMDGECPYCGKPLSEHKQLVPDE